MTLTPQTESVTRQMHEALAVLTMQHAPHNALDPVLVHSLIDALEWAKQHGARAVLLQSSLRNFSVGGDVARMIESIDHDGTLHWNLMQLVQAFDDFAGPIVASVRGVCVGGGFELALAADLIVAGESAKLGSIESTVGLFPIMGGAQRVAERAGSARAKEMAMLGRRYDAATLERWNIVNVVVDDEQLSGASLALAQELAHGPTVAISAAKRLVNLAASRGVPAADEAMQALQDEVMQTDDFAVGVASYRQNGLGLARFSGR